MWNYRENILLKRLWHTIRKRNIKKQHRRVASYWTPLLDRYFAGTIPVERVIAHKTFDSERIIWQYWGQGIQSDTLPEVVRLCFASVDKYKGDYQVIRLDDSTIADYLGFPQYFISKFKEGIISKTFFSDVLRLALLYCYGGVWMDATILLTSENWKERAFEDYFMFQRDGQESDKDYWEHSYAYYWGWYDGFLVKVLTSIIYAHSGSEVMGDLLQLMLYYWKNNDSAKDYFFLQILYELYIMRKDKRCAVVSDVVPHLLQTKLNGGGIGLDYEAILQQTPIHKMSY